MRQYIFPPLAFAIAFLLLSGRTVDAQGDPAIDHAQHIFDLIREEKFAEVAQEFNAQVAARLDADKLAQGWTLIKMQAGEFKSVSDKKVAMVGTAKAVTLVCKFERATLDTVVSFDADNKIAGLGFINPRPPD